MGICGRGLRSWRGYYKLGKINLVEKERQDKKILKIS